jgi:hypothetical protein
MERRREDSFSREVLTMLGEIRAMCAVNASHHEATKERLEKLEATDVRQWWVTAAFIPIMALLHSIARKLGI